MTSPTFQYGRRPPKNSPALRLAPLLTGTVPPPPAAVPFIGGLEAPARAAELRRAGLSVVALPEAATGVKPPLLLRRGNSFTLRLADGREWTGAAREIAEALGVG